MQSNREKVVNLSTLVTATTITLRFIDYNLSCSCRNLNRLINREGTHTVFSIFCIIITIIIGHGVVRVCANTQWAMWERANRAKRYFLFSVAASAAAVTNHRCWPSGLSQGSNNSGISSITPLPSSERSSLELLVLWSDRSRGEKKAQRSVEGRSSRKKRNTAVHFFDAPLSNNSSSYCGGGNTQI